jgi:hypothetical protein
MRPDRLRRVDELLRERPPMVQAPGELHDRVMFRVESVRPMRIAPAAARRSPGPSWLKVAACLALFTAAGVGLRDFLNEPAAPELPPVAIVKTSSPISPLPRIDPTRIDPTPLLSPARTITASLQQPLMNEAKSVIEDTKRAADFVVSCLPFTSAR